MALAQFGKFPNETLVLLINSEGKSYYDKQKSISAKMCETRTYNIKENGN
jgi:hypothetical protein